MTRQNRRGERFFSFETNIKSRSSSISDPNLVFSDRDIEERHADAMKLRERIKLEKIAKSYDSK